MACYSTGEWYQNISSFCIVGCGGVTHRDGLFKTHSLARCHLMCLLEFGMGLLVLYCQWWLIWVWVPCWCIHSAGVSDWFLFASWKLHWACVCDLFSLGLLWCWLCLLVLRLRWWCCLWLVVASCLVRLVVVFFALACFEIEVMSLFVYLKVYVGCASLVLSFYLGICKSVVGWKSRWLSCVVDGREYYVRCVEVDEMLFDW